MIKCFLKAGDSLYKYKSENFFTDGEKVSIFFNVKNSRTSALVHTHDFVEIVYISDGCGVHTVNGISYSVKKGDILFINYKQTHSFDSGDGGMSFYNLMISPELFSGELVNSENAFELLSLTAFEEFANSVNTECPFVSLDEENMSKIEMLFSMLNNEYYSARLGRNTMVNSLVMVILLFIFRAMSLGISREQKYLGNVAEDIIGYIEAHCNEKITLRDLADRCFYTPSYFSRLFKGTYGMTITEYITKARIEKSVDLLKNTDLNVDEICHQSGFTDKTRFYKQFRDVVGITPAEFRKKI